MATVTVGEFAISDCKVAVKTTSGQTPVFSDIADLEEFNLSIESNNETWYEINNGGWQNALNTAKALTGSFSGKRCLGDVGNDFIEALRYETGAACNVDYKITFPDDSTLAFTAVTTLTDIMGAATDVAPLSGDITGKGKPTYTA